MTWLLLRAMLVVRIHHLIYRLGLLCLDWSERLVEYQAGLVDEAEGNPIPRRAVPEHKDRDKAKT